MEVQLVMVDFIRTCSISSLLIGQVSTCQEVWMIGKMLQGFALVLSLELLLGSQRIKILWHYHH